MKKLILFFMLQMFFFSGLHAEFRPFIQKQIDLIYQRNEGNTTKEEIQKIAEEEMKHYIKSIENFILNKEVMFKKESPHLKEIFVLEKHIKYNKRRGNKYAVMRDEVLIKSYEIIRSQVHMIKSIFRSMDHYDINALDEKMNKQFIKNQLEITELTKVDYTEFLEKKDDHRILKSLQKNIKDYHAVIEINADILNYLALYKNRIFRLNKYENYGILEIAIYLDHTSWGNELNEMLDPYNLSIVKLLLVLFITILIYLIRTLLFRSIEFLLLKINFITKYSKEVINDIRIPLNYLLIIFNIDLIMYVYHDFNNIEIFSKVFNIIYSLLLSYILYRILNSIASIQINDIQQSDKKIKSEMVNVSIKIINFIIMIMGLLLVLHFAGANLTTVLSGLGIGGFAVAFAARETLSNFLGTISILMSDTYSQGDWIVVDDKQGTVVEIGLRVTTLRTFDNALISIPNGLIATKDVKNWNKRTLGRRIKMSIGVKYDSKPDNIHNAIEEIRKMLLTHPDIASDKTTYSENRNRKSAKLVSEEDELGIKRTLLVYLDEFSDSSINILVYCFSKKTVWQEWLAAKEDVMYKIMHILEKNDLEFAFPSMSLYNEKED